MTKRKQISMTFRYTREARIEVQTVGFAVSFVNETRFKIDNIRSWSITGMGMCARWITRCQLLFFSQQTNRLNQSSFLFSL